MDGLGLVKKLRNDVCTRSLQSSRLQVLVTMAAVTILLRRGIDCRSVLLTQGGFWCDCMMRLSALRTCGDLSLQWCGNRCFGTSPGKPNLNACPPPDFVVWVRGIWAGCGSWYRMWGVIAPIFFFPTYVAPPKIPRPYSRPLRRSCESSLPHVGHVIRLEWCCTSPVCMSHDPSPSRTTV